MPERNNRLKISWSVALQIGAILVASGVIIGQLRGLQAQVGRIESTMVTKDVISVLVKNADQQHTDLRGEDSRIWTYIYSIPAGKAEAQAKRRPK